MTVAMPRSRRVGVHVAHGAVLLISVYLGTIAATVVGPEDHDAVTLPLWWLAVLAGAIYYACPDRPAARTAWLVLVTACALGRSLTLGLVGTDYLTRGQEIAASLSWLVVWLCAVLAALVITADRLLNGGK